MTDSKQYNREYYQKHKEELKEKRKIRNEKQKQSKLLLQQLSDALDVYHNVGPYEDEDPAIEKFVNFIMQLLWHLLGELDKLGKSSEAKTLMDTKREQSLQEVKEFVANEIKHSE